MTIKERTRIPTDDLPPARLYFDDIEAIVELFQGLASSTEKATLNATYTLDTFECTELEELKKFGERTSRLEIAVTYHEEVRVPLATLIIGAHGAGGVFMAAIKIRGCECTGNCTRSSDSGRLGGKPFCAPSHGKSDWRPS